MKQETINHWKVRDLGDWIDRQSGGRLRECGIDPQTAAIGLLERLWKWSSMQVPAGDVGRCSDSTIARECGWTAEPAALIDALTTIGWIDRSEEHRLVLHDWAAHCEDLVHAKLARQLAYFADGSRPRLTKLGTKGAGDVTRQYDEQEQKAPECGIMRPNAASGRLPGPKPLPLPEPLSGPSRETRPGPDTNGERDADEPPGDVASSEWRHGCDCADLVEDLPGDEPVTGRGSVQRALSFVYLVEARRGGEQLWDEIKATLRRLAEAEAGTQLREIFRQLRRFEDGAYEGRGNAAIIAQGDKRFSRIEEAIRLQRMPGGSTRPARERPGSGRGKGGGSGGMRKLNEVGFGN